jgi:quinol monooxygenase YgiN
MSISLGVAVVATLAALIFTGLLVRRCIRVPRLDIAALLCACCGLSIALAAQTIGYYHGFGATTFRALHLCAQLLTPLALAWALAELTGKSLGARFAARLALGGLCVVAAVVLASDPLSSSSFTNAWPAAGVYYQLIPNAILELIAVAVTLSVVLALMVAGLRARRYPDWREVFRAVVLAGIGALATDALRAGLPAKSAYAAVCLAAAVFAWLAARQASRVRLNVLRLGGPVWDEDSGAFVRYNEDTGEFAPYRDDMDYPVGGQARGFGHDGGYGGGHGPGYDRGDAGMSGWYADGAPAGEEGGDADFQGWFRDERGDTGGFPAQGADTGGFPAGPGEGYGFGRAPGGNGTNGHSLAPFDTGAPFGTGTSFETGDRLPPVGGYAGPGALPGPAEVDMAAAMAPLDAGTSRLYGQIAIYTLLDSRAEDFDRLAHQVVEQVKAHEPGALVYAMHGVPSAPMQRILYEVYRDDTAYDEHMRQPYVQQFEEERKPCLLATNVIELGVRHAKFSAPPAQGRAARGEELRSWGGAR